MYQLFFFFYLITIHIVSNNVSYPFNAKNMPKLCLIIILTLNVHAFEGYANLFNLDTF